MRERMHGGKADISLISTDAGFRRLAAMLAAAGLLATASTIIPALGGTDFYKLSAVGASLFLFLTNVVFLLQRAVQPWMRTMQAYTLLAIALVAIVLSEPVSWGPELLAALSIALLIKYRTVKGTTVVLALSGLVLGTGVIATLVHPDGSFANALGIVVAFTAGFAIVYFAFYEELIAAIRENRVLRETDARRVATVASLRKGIAEATAQYEESLAKTEELASLVETLQKRLATLEYTDGTDDLSHYNLTNREIDVLLALVRTKGSNKEIAEDLEISPETVKTHLYRICNKVGVDTRVDLIDSFYWTTRP